MKTLRICLVMFGSHFGTINARLPSRIRLFEQICGTFYLLINKMPEIQFSSGKIKVIDLKKTIPFKCSTQTSQVSKIIWLFKSLIIQIKMASKLVKISPEIEIIIFTAGIPFVLPLMFFGKVMGKKVVVFAGGSPSRSFAEANPGAIVSFYSFKMLEKACYHLSDNIAIETQSSILFQELDTFRNKVSIYNALIYMDVDTFKIKDKINDRNNLVGYIGNLENGKGIINFIKAAKLILKQRNDIEFLIVGDGPLFERVKGMLKGDDLHDMFKLTGWIPHDEIPIYLNKLRLLVLPSYSEGLPGIILEGMACGTPVLVTSVGGIPEIIEDGKTGFILENNLPECIARNIVRALNYENLGEIGENARTLIEEKYTFESIAERYKEILSNL